MPKIRTSKTVAKRFKITATGKLMRGCTLQNHRMKKSANQKRRLDREYSVDPVRSKTMGAMMGGNL